MNPRVGWAELPQSLRVAIEERAGRFVSEESMATGHSCLIGMKLRTAEGSYFLKGVPSDRAAAVRTQRYERLVSPYVEQISPALAFHLEQDGWDVLGFHFLEGYRHADLSPGSPDLARIAGALQVLAQTGIPNGVDVRLAEQRYAAYADGDSSAFAGRTLCHTDLHKHNILVQDSDPRCRLVDWAWPTAGADWFDTACVILQLIKEGHRPKEAEAWGVGIVAYEWAQEVDVSRFVLAVKNLWAEIAEADPQRWKISVAAAAAHWAEYRGVAT